MPDVTLIVAQGADLFRPFQASDYNGVPIVGTFLSSDTLAGVIWPAGTSPASRLAVVPVLAWISPAAGTWSYQLPTSVSVQIPPGLYTIGVTATRGGDSAELLDATLEVTAYGTVLVPVPVSPVPTQATAQRLSILYCTDEDILVRIGGEYVSLDHDDQALAAGSDGVFAPADPWTLVSASNNFTTQTVNTGSVVHLRKPASSFPSGGHLLSVSAVNGSALTLRRRGMPAGIGQAPAPSTGLSGVEFGIVTFAPQIEEESFQLNQLYAIDPTIAGRAPSDLVDMRPLRRACVLRVLLNRYITVSQGGSGDYAIKIDQIRFELGEVSAKLQLRWGNAVTPWNVTNWFSTRLVR